MVNALNTIAPIANRDLLFGDLPLSYWAGIKSNEAPWTQFAEVESSLASGRQADAVTILLTIVDTPGFEARHYLQAYHFLKVLGIAPPAELELFGVVAEVSIEDGHDFLAVYNDHSARYYNYSGSAIVWDTTNIAIAQKIDNILTLGKEIVGKIGPWDADRLPAPKPNFARINFLTSHGLYFGEAPQSILFNDPMSRGIMYAMLDMIETLAAFAG